MQRFGVYYLWRIQAEEVRPWLPIQFNYRHFPHPTKKFTRDTLNWPLLAEFLNPPRDVALTLVECLDLLLCTITVFHFIINYDD